VWYSQVKFGLYQIEKGGCDGGTGIGAICQYSTIWHTNLSKAYAKVVVVLGYFLCLVFGDCSGYLIDWFDLRQKA
jgi:hypothetical protein